MFMSMLCAFNWLKPKQNKDVNLINPHSLLVNDVDVSIGIDEFHLISVVLVQGLCVSSVCEQATTLYLPGQQTWNLSLWT